MELTANAVWREPQSASPAPDRGDDHLWALLGAYEGSILVMERVIRDPINVDGMARVRVRRAPDLGEHTEDVLREMGYSPEEIGRLREAGAI